jgi:hypothetical protein
MQGGGVYFIYINIFYADHGCYYIDYGVYRSYFVKMYLFRANAVYPGFRPGYAVKYIQAAAFYRGGKHTIMDKGGYFLYSPVSMGMPMVRPGGRMRWRMGLLLQNYLKVCAPDAQFLLFFYMQVVTGKFKSG